MSIGAQRKIVELRMRDLVQGPMSTRARGEAAYPGIRDSLLSHGDADFVLTFSGIRFVSPSFLDETIVRLVEESSELRGRITIVDLSEALSRALTFALDARRVPAWAMKVVPRAD